MIGFKRKILAYSALYFISINSTAAAEEFSFDVSDFDKQPFEWGGFAEFDIETLNYNQDSALYKIGFPDQTELESSDRYIGRLELNTAYTINQFKATLTLHTDLTHDYLGSEEETVVYEALASYQLNSSAMFEAGKTALKWGKGYAWNPVGFVERAKDPNDPTLSREGYVMAAADVIFSSNRDLKTIAFTPVILPVTENINTEYSKQSDTNYAAKLYMLYRNIDIDILALAEGSLSARYGIDFSFNLSTNLEFHGEWAYISEVNKTIFDGNGSPSSLTQSANRSLLGLRYLTENDTTYIAEVYYNEGGYNEDELSYFYKMIHDRYETDPSFLLSPSFKQLANPYLQRNPAQRYFYLRASSKEPFDILYFSTALTGIANLEDHSYSIAPEMTYTRFTNLELLIKATFLHGGRSTEFGEKPNDSKWELRMKYYF